MTTARKATRAKTAKAQPVEELPNPALEVATDESLNTEIVDDEDDEAIVAETDGEAVATEADTDPSLDQEVEDPVIDTKPDFVADEPVTETVINQVSPEIAVKQPEINRALGFAKGTCLNDAKTPLGYIHLVATTDGLTVQGYNRLAGSSSQCPYTHKVTSPCDEPIFDLLVPTTLVDLVGKEQPDSTIKLSQQGRFLVIGSGDDEFRLKTFPGKFPAIPFPKSTLNWEAEGFIEALKTLCTLVGDEGNILIQFNRNGGWRMEGNQGAALLVYYTPPQAIKSEKEEEKEPFANFKFTAKSLKALLGFTGKVDITIGDAQAEEVTTQRMAIESDGVFISCEMLMTPEKGHQSIRRVLGKITKNTPTVEIDPAVMAAKVEKSVVLLEKEATLDITMTPLGLNANITLASDAEAGASEQHLSATYVNKPSEVSFRTNVAHLKNALNALTTTVAKLAVTDQLLAVSGGNLTVLIGHVEGA